LFISEGEVSGCEGKRPAKIRKDDGELSVGAMALKIVADTKEQTQKGLTKVFCICCSFLKRPELPHFAANIG